MELIDLTGQRFGRLTVLRRVHGKYWECLCDCGNTRVVSRDHLGRDTNSCGCLRREVSATKNKRHGETKTRLHNLWVTIRQRCSNPNIPESHIYHDRSISVCDEWQTYENFRDWALANGYDPTAKRGVTTIDRIDNEKGYSPENCRFVTLTENQRNRRDTRRFLFDGQMLTTGEVSEITGTSVQLIGERLRRGWSIERAALVPARVMHYKDGSTNYGK